MKISRNLIGLIALSSAGLVQAQSMFRGDPAHSGTYAGQAPRQFHRVKWRFPTGDRVVSSPVFQDKVLYFGGDDGNIYAVDAETGRQIWKRSGVLNGTLKARDLTSGEVLWDFQTEASKQNKGWVLTADRKFNGPMLYYSSWREAPVVATERQFGIGAIFSSPLAVNGVDYFGSTDGNLYALE